jgi:hypothetical protein
MICLKNLAFSGGGWLNILTRFIDRLLDSINYHLSDYAP